MTDWRTDPEVVAAREAMERAYYATNLHGHHPGVDITSEAYGAAVERAVLKAQPCWKEWAQLGRCKPGSALTEIAGLCPPCKARAEGATG